MTLDELLALICSTNQPALRCDSRLVKAGDVFIAVKGSAVDGHDFISQAVDRGAKYIVSEKVLNSTPAELILVDDCSKAAALLAQASCGYPMRQLTNLAVTGTNGKTTVSFLVRSIIQKADQKCGLIGTIVYDTGNQSSNATLTTPDSLDIARQQQQMIQADAKYMVIEASSHALSQNRLDGINFTAAAFTNLTGDHLDYHKTEDNYLAAKTKLFEALTADSTAVLNKQSPHAIKIAEKTKAKILWYAIDSPACLTAHIESMDTSGSAFVLEYADQKERVKINLPGRHNISNALAAVGLCIGAGFDLETIAAGLSNLKSVPGRLEPIAWDGDFSVLIDYAHTDDALKNVLSTLRPLCAGKLIVVFGCGGDRDRTKRPRMAKVAEELADFIIVTSDNPRTEPPEDITDQIVAGFKNAARDNIVVEVDRKKAIGLAVTTAAKGDIVLIAGKGHETYQVLGKRKIDFSDYDVAMGFLKNVK